MDLISYVPISNTQHCHYNIPCRQSATNYHSHGKIDTCIEHYSIDLCNIKVKSLSDESVISLINVQVHTAHSIDDLFLLLQGINGYRTENNEATGKLIEILKPSQVTATKQKS